ncbi:AraC-binding-like domain-containing protein [Devosia enhydra]|uniref:AraC-binding-like domain-containing protein n=1 Tax=Devosia enhydra TaxID=665118 RepID=A0A1K2HY18_9HYPH|nr:AraC-binding-like domain-containing protein [Devosia enhydra]
MHGSSSPHLVHTRSHEATTGEAPRPFSSVLFSQTNGFDFAGGGGRMQSTTAMLPRHGLRLGRVRSTGHEISLVEQDHFSLLLPLRGLIAVETRGRFWDTRPGTLLAVGTGARRTTAIADSAQGFEAALLMIPIPFLAQTLHARSDRAVPFAGRFATLMAAGGLVARLPLILGELMEAEAQRIDSRRLGHVEGQLLDILGLLLDPEPDEAHAADPSAEARVSRVEAMMEERLAEPLSITALAGELGIGPRLLQMMFQARRGISPRQMLHRFRLRSARQRLLSGAPGLDVTGVALEAGFTHLGRFAHAYRVAFGEWPRQTLLRSRRLA